MMKQQMHKLPTIYYITLVNKGSTRFEATVPSSGGPCPVPAKLHKQLNAELVIFFKLYIWFVVKFKIITMLQYFSYNKIFLDCNNIERSLFRCENFKSLKQKCIPYR
jgi:hypothetical protein